MVSPHHSSARWCTRLIALAIGICSAGVPRAAAQCSDLWTPLFGGSPSVSDTVRAATVWDPDGTGALAALPVIGGDFTTIGGAPFGTIARFDGQRWLPVRASSSTGISGKVEALTTWDIDGPGGQPPVLAAGGEFGGGGVMLSRVGYWDGVSWNSLNGGFAGGFGVGVASLTTWDPDGPGPLNDRLVAGGNFTTTVVGGTAVSRIAQWGGAAWQPIGVGFLNGDTTALGTWDPDGPGPMTARLVAGGNWIMSGATTVNRIAQWDGAAWQPFGTGFAGTVTGITTWDEDGPGPLNPHLVAVTDSVIARWTGSAWATFGTGVGSGAASLASWDPDGPGPGNPRLVAGGDFTFGGNRIATWNGSVWQSIGLGMTTRVEAISLWDRDGDGPAHATPFVGGTLEASGVRVLSNTASWTGTEWLPIGQGIHANGVSTLTTWDPDGAGPAIRQVIAGGGFAAASGNNVQNVARWDGGEWRALAAGVNGGVEDLTTWDPDGGGPLDERLLAVGTFTTAGATTLNRIGSFDGTQWHAFGTGIGGAVSAVASWDLDGPGGAPARVAVGGSFTTAGGNPAQYGAYWDGSAWQSLPGLGNFVGDLIAWSSTGNPADTLLYAGGGMVLGGTPITSYATRWNGGAWGPLDNGIGDSVFAFTTWNGGGGEQLILGGAFTQVFSSMMNFLRHRVTGFNGTTWGAGFESGFGPTAAVFSLCTWDPDGPAGPSGRQVVAGGSFTRTVASPTPILNNVARYGGGWQPFGTGFNSSPADIISWDPDGPGPLYETIVAAGAFTEASDLPSSGIVALVAQPPAFTLQQAAPGGIAVGGTAMINTAAYYGSPNVFYQWRRNGVNLVNGPTGSGSVIVGAQNPVLTITNAQCADAGMYDAIATNACGSATSTPTTLAISACPPACPGDISGDGMVGLGDIAVLIQNWSFTVPPAPASADLDGSGDIGLGDIAVVVQNWGTVCP